MNTLPELLTTAEVAAITRTSKETVRYWRHRGTGPESFKVGKHVRYERDALLRWLEDQQRLDTSAKAG